MLPVFIISLASILYQILLMKLMSVVQWSHLVAFILALVMLGHSMGGVLLSFTKGALEKRIQAGRLVLSLIFSGSIFTSFLLVQKLPLIPQEILWNPYQVFLFLIYFLILSFPFMIASTFVGSYYLDRSRAGGHIYFYDLMGAACGSIVIILLISSIGSKASLTFISSIGLIASICLYHKKRFFVLMLIIIIVAMNFIWPKDKFKFHISSHKAMERALLVPETRVLHHHDTAKISLDLVESKTIPFRYAPGLSLKYQGSLPKQLGIYINGDSFIPINQITSFAKLLPHQEYVLERIPYLIRKNINSVLILGVDGGDSVHHALASGAKEVFVVSNSKELFNIFDKYSNYSANIFNSDNVVKVIADSRNYIRRSKNLFDLIVITPHESQTAHLGGAYSTSPNYLLTVDGINDMADRLTSNGMIVFSRWIHHPPRDSIRLFATAAKAMKRWETQKFKDKLALLRGIQTALFAISKSSFQAGELKIMREFTSNMSFDLVYLPDVKSNEVNKYNQNIKPLAYQLTQDIIRGGDLASRYGYNLDPPTDDRPFFNHFLKFKTFKTLIMQSNNLGIPLLDWNHSLLLIAFMFACILGLLLILLSCVAQYRELKKIPTSLARQLIYFGCLGLAFMFIEITMINKLISFLEHPLYSVGIVYFSFFLCTSLGSVHSSFLFRSLKAPKAIITSVAIIIVTGILVQLVINSWIGSLLYLPILYRFVIVFVILAPLAYFMGMPFPLGLEHFRQKSTGPIGIALATNGAFSVIGALGGGILTIYIGFDATVVISLLLYFMAGIIFFRGALE